MSGLRIYGIARTRAFRVLWVARELGLLLPAHSGRDRAPLGRAKPDYLAINPNGRLPAIEDGGFALWELLAITLYLAKKHSPGRPDPAALEDEAKAWQWSLWAVQEVDRGVNIWSLHALRLPPAERDPSGWPRRWRCSSRRSRCSTSVLADRRYLLGADFTIADLNVAAVISRAVEMDLSGKPRLQDWLRRCLERPAARAARALRAKADAAVPVEVMRAIARHNRLWNRAGAPQPCRNGAPASCSTVARAPAPSSSFWCIRAARSGPGRTPAPGRSRRGIFRAPRSPHRGKARARGGNWWLRRRR